MQPPPLVDRRERRRRTADSPPPEPSGARSCSCQHFSEAVPRSAPARGKWPTAWMVSALLLIGGCGASDDATALPDARMRIATEPRPSAPRTATTPDTPEGSAVTELSPLELSPPVAKQVPRSVTLHGHQRSDEYAWLRDLNDPDTRAYLEAENRYAAGVMSAAADLERTLYDEMIARIEEDDRGVPIRRGPWLYYWRIEKGKQYHAHYRRLDSPGAVEELLLDENALAEGEEFFSLGLLEISPDHRLAAIATDTEGDERHVLRIKDLTTGEALPDEIVDAAPSVAWSADGRTLFYVTLDDANRPYRAWRHRLGDSSPDTLIWEETDEAFFLDVGNSN